MTSSVMSCRFVSWTGTVKNSEFCSSSHIARGGTRNKDSKDN